VQVRPALRSSDRLPALISAVSEQQQMQPSVFRLPSKWWLVVVSSSSQPPRGGPTNRLDRGGCTVRCLCAAGLGVLLLHCVLPVGVCS
jgi:hypothetical protein